jgi:hypothetical protein
MVLPFAWGMLAGAMLIAAAYALGRRNAKKKAEWWEQYGIRDSRAVELLKTFPDADVAGWDGPGWYFWDETEAHCHGPFGTKVEAEVAMKKYCLELSGPQPFEKEADRQQAEFDAYPHDQDGNPIQKEGT